MFTNVSILTSSAITVESRAALSIVELEPIQTLFPIIIEPTCGKWLLFVPSKIKPKPSLPIVVFDWITEPCPIFVLPKIDVLLSIFTLFPNSTLFPI